ncbi:MAG TPA: GNAT family N-acetyltransferase [Chitinophagaceae bacterium]|nr:GNAT family N-acetyltransferase [Chitinophagaceae bacterium]
MLIQRRQAENKGMFYVENEGEVQAEMIYHMSAPEKMVIEHTEVGEELRGQNVGYELVHAAVEYARQHHIKVTVWCPFARKVFDRKPDWGDVLDK